MMETKNDFIEYLQEMQDTELSTNQKVIQYLKNNGVSNNDISKLLNINIRNIYRMKNRMEQIATGDIATGDIATGDIATGDIATTKEAFSKLQEKVNYQELYVEACEKFKYNMGKELTEYFEQWDGLNFSAKDGIAGLCELTMTEIETIYQWWQENR